MRCATLSTLAMLLAGSAALGQEVEHIESPGSLSSTGLTEKPTVDADIDPEQVRIEIERAHLRVQATMDSRLDAEDRNAEWADSIEKSISERLMAIDGFDSQSLSVICKTTLCRVQINPFTDDHEAAFAAEIWSVLASLPEIDPTISRTRSQVRYYLFRRDEDPRTAGPRVLLASHFH